MAKGSRADMTSYYCDHFSLKGGPGTMAHGAESGVPIRARSEWLDIPQPCLCKTKCELTFHTVEVPEGPCLLLVVLYQL
jgi:hypothetical protein